MKTTVAPPRNKKLAKKDVDKVRAEEAAAGVPEEFQFPEKFKVIPKEQRRKFPPEAFEDRNTKVRISIYLDLDVLNAFKSLAEKPGSLPYQTQINTALREIVEVSGGKDAVAELRQAKSLIDAALRKIS